MSLIISILSLGFLLGIRHATDADHVVAVTTIVSKQQKISQSSIVGILWGIGHSLTVTLVAIPIMLLSLTIPPRIGLGMEFSVGVMLVILGVLNLSGITKKINESFTPLVHTHSHVSETGVKHAHLHFHLGDFLQGSIHHLGLFHTLRPLLIGLVHGLAGSAAVALLILSTIKDPYSAVIYLLLFNLGVICGMMLITTFLGVSIAAIQKKSLAINKYLVFASGILSTLFGLYVMYHTGIVGGLFSPTVNWTPE